MARGGGGVAQCGPHPSPLNNPIYIYVSSSHSSEDLSITGDSVWRNLAANKTTGLAGERGKNEEEPHWKWGRTATGRLGGGGGGGGTGRPGEGELLPALLGRSYRFSVHTILPAWARNPADIRLEKRKILNRGYNGKWERIKWKNDTELQGFPKRKIFFNEEKPGIVQS